MAENRAASSDRRSDDRRFDDRRADSVDVVEDRRAGAVFFFAGSRTILYFLTLFFFKDFLTSFKYFKLVLIMG